MPNLNPPAFDAWPISRGFEAAAVLTWWHGRPITYAVFLSHAQALSERLPETGAVLNLCDDRAAFVLGWVAALLRGLPTVLPSDRSASAIANAAADGDASCLLTDRSRPWDLPGRVRRVQIDFDGEISSKRAPPPVIAGNRIAAILYTSGSTGQPKASIKRWGSLVSGARSLGKMLGWHEGKAAYQVIGAIAPQHMFGLETTVMLPLQWGVSINPARPLLPADLEAILSVQKQPSWLMMTPLHAAAYLSANLDCGGRLSGAISSTMALSAETATGLEALWKVPVNEIYGSTETGMIGLRRTCKTPQWQLADDLTLDFSSPQVVVTGRADMPAHTLNDQVEAGETRCFRLLGRNSDIVKVLTSREVKDTFAQQGAEAASSTPAEFHDYIVKEIARWQKVAHDAGVKPE